MLKLKFQAVLLLCVINGFARSEEKAELPEGLKYVEPALISNGTFQLRSIQGSIKNPGPEWKWMQDARPGPAKGVEIYLCGGGPTQVFVVAMLPGKKNIRTAKG